jgi:putative transposase
MYDQKKELPALKKACPEFCGVNSQCLQDVVITLDKAFKSFFRRIKQNEKPGFPRFKSAIRFKSFTLTQTGWKLDGRNLYIKNVGRFKLFLSRPVEGNINTVLRQSMEDGQNGQTLLLIVRKN